MASIMKAWLVLLVFFSFAVQAKVTLEQNTLTYLGQITEYDNSHTQTLLNNHPNIDTLVITSGGGNVNLGMDLAELILKHKLKVRIESWCFSSCANYILLAGSPTEIADDAVIGWHGNAKSARWRNQDIDAMVANLPEPERKKQWRELRKKYDEIITLATERENAFYRRVGVDPQLLSVGLSPSLYQAAIDKKARGWTYSQQVLQAFGVKNVEFGQWKPRSLSSFPLLIIDDVTAIAH